MLAETKTGEKYQELLTKAVSLVEKRGFEEIRANLDGYDDPNSFAQQKQDNEYAPDITATNEHGKHYFEIAQKTENVNNLVSKWKLLSTIAEMKNGGLSILVPYGQNKFTQEIVDTYDINANLIKLS